MTKKILKFLLYGFILWGTLLVYAYFIQPVKTIDPAFFDALMSIAVALFTVVFVFAIFRRKRVLFFNDGLMAGLIWMVECLILDMFLYHWGPMKMTFMAYFTEIGLNYLAIAIIAGGTGYLADKIVHKHTHPEHYK